ncbi:TetR/AcrR family transcriptional regulator [Actinomadura parmotrematis]|uniref:TetR family transcriptional regulator n=1 Tax=Actinomadura parmotrematis TaxID=2864039 RepID=A0ABS7FVI3_9ACTN|nr:TetR family transcriptional regulator [Actinomadura parmotrematis]MBW8483975.1 TetR family transcriptional regulator [Actinomadura parmotrematis]
MSSSIHGAGPPDGGSGAAASGRERVLDVATRLFAALGYDGTSTRLIAEAAGLNVATVAYHAGGKRELYLAVMERAHRLEQEALAGALAAFTPDAAGVRALVDGYLDFCVAHPQVPALWMHRWLSDAADVADLEARYARPLIDTIIAAIGPAVPAGVDVEYAVMTVIWVTHGFGAGGLPAAGGERRRLDDPAEVARFRAHLHQLVERMLGL